MNTRSYVIEDSCDEDEETGEPTPRQKAREKLVAELAAKWNDAHHRIEQRSWRSDEDRDAEADYLGEMAEERAITVEADALAAGASAEDAKQAGDAAAQAFHAEINERNQLVHEELAAIEDLLGELGARMAKALFQWAADRRPRARRRARACLHAPCSTSDSANEEEEAST